jgi:enoyl-CoA hydratase/carnithine racemase
MASENGGAVGRRAVLAAASVGSIALASGAAKSAAGSRPASASAKQVTLTRQGAIAIITIDRADHDNIVDRQGLDDLVEVWSAYKADDALRVAIFTGAGTESFCGGIDTSFINKIPNPNTPPARDEGVRTYTAKQNKCWKPVIAAINGFVAGPGLHFMLDADICIAAPEATFFDIHLHRTGAVPVFEPIEMARKVPLEAVTRLFLLGPNEPWTAERARSLGLISEVVPRDRLMSRAVELARHIVALDPDLVRGTIESLYKARELGVREAVDRGLIIRQITGYRFAPMAGKPVRDLARPKS